jgi:hypothetical protein
MSDPIQINTKKVVFPAVRGEARAKLDRFLKNVGEFMDVEIDLHETVIVEAEVDADRQDVVTILTKVAANEKRKATNGSK